MATKASSTTETTENHDESRDRPLMHTNSAAIEKLIQRAKDRGYVTHEELNQVLPPDQMSSEQI
jgi:RNA polymerase primary sigma factor